MTMIASCASCGNDMRIYQKNGTWKSNRSNAHRTFCNHPVHKICFDKIKNNFGNHCPFCQKTPWVKLEVVKLPKSELWTQENIGYLILLAIAVFVSVSLIINSK